MILSRCKAAAKAARKNRLMIPNYSSPSPGSDVPQSINPSTEASMYPSVSSFSPSASYIIAFEFSLVFCHGYPFSILQLSLLIIFFAIEFNLQSSKLLLRRMLFASLVTNRHVYSDV